MDANHGKDAAELGEAPFSRCVSSIDDKISLHNATTLGLQGPCVQEWPHSSLTIHSLFTNGRDDTIEGMSVASDGHLCHQPFFPLPKLFDIRKFFV